MRITDEYLQKIKPASPKTSEKYPWNLYRFLKKQSKRNNIYVYHGALNRSNQKEYFFAITICGNGAKGADNIGIFESKLRQSSKTSTLEMHSYRNYDFSRFHEVSKEFFENYLKNSK